MTARRVRLRLRLHVFHPDVRTRADARFDRPPPPPPHPPAYGNEGEVGEGLADCFARGVCKREDVFVTSKLWVSSAFPDTVAAALAKTLADLRLTYVRRLPPAQRSHTHTLSPTHPPTRSPRAPRPTRSWTCT